MNKLILPKSHISWSQIQVWKSNPARYRKEYFENGKKLDSSYLRFGKGIAEMVEELEEIQKTSGTKELALMKLVEKYSLDEGTQIALLDLDTEGISEYKIEIEIKGVPMLMFLDKYVPRDHSIKEFKTGKIPWDKAKVHKHDQLLVYAVGLRAKTGKMPEYCDLYWLETSEKSDDTGDFWAKVDKKLKLTGKVKSFHREFDARELDRMEEDIVKTAIEISEAYQAFLAEV